MGTVEEVENIFIRRNPGTQAALLIKEPVTELWSWQ